MNFIAIIEMFKKLLIKEHKKRLSHNQFLQLKKLIHNFN